MLLYLSKSKRILLVIIFLQFQILGLAQSALESLTSSLNAPYNSTCLLIFDGSYTCTGFLINDGFNSGKPLIMTSAHCLPSVDGVNSLVTIFGRRKIGGRLDAIEWSSTIGAQLLAQSQELDYALFELEEFPPLEMQAHYLGWKQQLNNNQVVYSLHHPSFDFQRTVVHNNRVSITTYPADLATGVPPIKNGHWQIKGWEFGETTIGSSGSALIDINNQALGVLSGGQTSQFYGVIDYYSRIDLIISDIKSQIPQLLVEDQTFTNGYSVSEDSGTIKISNYNSLDTAASVINILAGEQITEFFSQYQSGKLLGAYISIEDWESDLLNDISVILESDGQIIYEENVNLFDLNRGSENYIPFIIPQIVEGPVSVGLRLNAINASDQISVIRSSRDQQSLFFSLLASDYVLNEFEKIPQPGLLVYPNPSKSIFLIYSEKPEEVTVTNLNGKVFHLMVKSVNDDQFLIDLSSYESGTYILQILTEGKQYFIEKIILK